jgi:hypothetical protein
MFDEIIGFDELANPFERSLSGRIAADGKDPVIFSYQAPWSMRVIWSQKDELSGGSSASVKFFQDFQK